MRVNRQEFHVRGHREFIRHDKIFGAGWNVNLPVHFQLHQHRVQRRGMIREIQPQAGLNPLRLAGRLQVDVEHQVRTCIES